MTRARQRRARAPMRRWPAVLMIAMGVACATDASATERGLDVLHYAATVEPDIVARTLTGRVTIRVRVLAEGTTSVRFDRGELAIDSLREGGATLDFELQPRRLRVRLRGLAKAGEMRTIEIEYHGAPRFGLQFVPERSQVYTIFSTSQWLVCIDAPEDQATLELGVVLPAGRRAVGSGRLVAERPRLAATVLHEWRQDQPMPSYTFGFAAGKFVEATAKRKGVAFRYLGELLSSGDLARVFQDTPDMIDFFADHAGVPYPGPSYTQVLVANTIGQEANGFALLSDPYGQGVLDDPTRISLSAHEVAHQWWGNGVTCREWTHFWLNEGFATFMAAAYNEHRFGRDAYLRDMEAARARYEQIRE